MNKYINLRWSDYRIQHIARHGITPEEVEEAILKDDFKLLKKYQKSTSFPGKYLYLAYGKTKEGRLLTVLLLNSEGTEYIPITARNMSHTERQQYFRKGK
ncbi:MAG: hypothetical protein ACOX7L_05645 [Dethiobacteria bacterium]|jgi:uncharacterized DUF497 family protein